MQPGTTRATRNPVAPQAIIEEPPAGYTVRILRSPEEVETVRAVWEKWQDHPNSDIDHFLLVCRIRDEVHRPHVIVVSRQNQPCAMLVARIEEGRIAPPFGYIRPVQFAVIRLAVLYKGLLGQIDDAVAATMLAALQSALNSGEADVIDLYHLRKDSALLKAALGGVSRLWRDGRPDWSTHWEMTLPSEVGGVLQSMKSKHRSWIKRKGRELEEAFSGRIAFAGFPPGGNVESLCRDLEVVGRLTYQRALGEGFADDLDHRERFALFNRRSALRAWTLRIDDAPRAFCLGFVYGNTFHFSETGYDPSLRSYEIGTLLFLFMVDALTREGIQKFNFGFGDAYYKQRFGDHSWNEATIFLYARTPKGFAARVCTGCLGAITATSRQLMTRLGLLDKLKTAWRRRLAANTAKTP